jgi:hypothetical protein
VESNSGKRKKGEKIDIGTRGWRLRIKVKRGEDIKGNGK